MTVAYVPRLPFVVSAKGIGSRDVVGLTHKPCGFESLSTFAG